MDFQTWLASRIDAQSLTIEMLELLRAQWEAQQPAPPAPVLIVPTADCSWPQRAYWQPVTQ